MANDAQYADISNLVLKCSVSCTLDTSTAYLNELDSQCLTDCFAHHLALKTHVEREYKSLIN
jgi:hypothetical protein